MVSGGSWRRRANIWYSMAGWRVHWVWTKMASILTIRTLGIITVKSIGLAVHGRRRHVNSWNIEACRISI